MILETNLKDVGKRPKCPGCSSPNPVSRGLYWTCRNCLRNWIKHPRGKFRKKLVRPSCSFCGAPSEKVWSDGDKWKCSKCNKTWSKYNWPKRKDLGERPKCPDCGASDPTSQGGSWWCIACGRTWTKERRRSFELLNSSIVEI
jgi:hypothetical protein